MPNLLHIFQAASGVSAPNRSSLPLIATVVEPFVETLVETFVETFIETFIDTFIPTRPADPNTPHIQAHPTVLRPSKSRAQL